MSSWCSGRGPSRRVTSIKERYEINTKDLQFYKKLRKKDKEMNLRKIDALVAEIMEWYIGISRTSRGDKYLMWWNKNLTPFRTGMDHGQRLEPATPNEIKQLSWVSEPQIAKEYRLPHFTLDISAAWEVVERLIKEGYVIHILSPDDLSNWECNIVGDREVAVKAHTAPLAFCLAALKLKGVEYE